MAVSMMILGTTFYTHSVGIGSLVCMLVYTAGFAMSWGAGLLGIAGRDFPEYDPFDCYEYCRCRAVDCQFPCLLDFPDAR